MLIETFRLYTPEDLEGQACDFLRNATKMYDSPAGMCRLVGESTWEGVVDGASIMVRMFDDRKVTVTGAGDLTAIAASIELVDRPTFERLLGQYWEWSKTI